MKKLLSLIMLCSLTLNAMEEPSAPPAYDVQPETQLSTWVYDLNAVLNAHAPINSAQDPEDSDDVSSDTQDSNESDDDSDSIVSPHPLSQDLKYRHTMICTEVMLKNKKNNRCFFSQHLSWAVGENGSIVPTADSSCWKIMHDDSAKPQPELSAEGREDLEHKRKNVWPAILATIKNTTYEPNVRLTKVCENTNKASIKYSVAKKINGTSTLLQSVTEMTIPLYGAGYRAEHIAEIKNEDGPILLCITAPSVSTRWCMQDYLDQLGK